MVRTLEDVQSWGNVELPPPGTYQCKCVRVAAGKSAKKGTPFVRLGWVATSGENIQDDLFVTGNTLPRLACVAQRVCGVAKDHSLPDDDEEAARHLARIIFDSVKGKSAMVTIAEELEQGRLRRRVPFSGYAAPGREEGTPAPRAAATAPAPEEETGISDEEAERAFGGAPEEADVPF
ncbi:MAG: hypothetical protein ABII00_06730 [Elusimicrobiota bacterium]